MDWSCDRTQPCVTLKDVRSRSQRWKKRRLASCLRRLFTTRSENSRRKREKKVFCAAKISFNIVAHSGLIEEAFSGHCYGRLKLGYFLLHSFCFSTHTVVFSMRQDSNLHSLVLLSNTREVARFVVREKEKMLHVYKGLPIYLD